PFSFYDCVDFRVLHSFPTRRSSDLWTVGVEQALTDTLSLEAGISTGFRAPTIEEMYSTTGAPDDWNVVANPDLEAESSNNLDLRSEEHTSELQSRENLVCRLLLEKK